MDEVTPAELREGKAGLRVFDVRRDPDDRRIPGSIRVEGTALEGSDDLPFGKDEDVVLYCGSGNSCSRIARSLRERGYRASALQGGYKAWLEAGLPTEELE